MENLYEAVDYIISEGKELEAIDLLIASHRNKYIQFTKSGTRWREWYEVSHWNWIKYNVLGYIFWEYSVYYPIRKYVFRKPYPWEGYENVDLDNI